MTEAKRGGGERKASFREPLDVFAVVLKGHPCTGKSSLARMLCERLRCPLIDKDDVKGVLETQREKLNSHVSDASNTLSLDIAWSLLAKQLSLGLHCVVDTTLSRPSHLLGARRVSTAHSAKLVVVECSASDERVWKQRLERRVFEDNHRHDNDNDNDNDWNESRRQGRNDCHKPQSWEALQVLISSYGGSYAYNPLEHGADYFLSFDTCWCEEKQNETLDKIVGIITSSPPPQQQQQSQ